MSTPVQLITVAPTGSKLVAALLFPAGKVAGAASNVTGGTVPGTTAVGSGATVIYFGLTETPAGSSQFKASIVVGGTALPDTDPGLPYTVEARIVWQPSDGGSAPDITVYANLPALFGASIRPAWTEEPTPNMLGGVLIGGVWGPASSGSGGTGSFTDDDRNKLVEVHAAMPFIGNVPA